MSQHKSEALTVHRMNAAKEPARDINRPHVPRFRAILRVIAWLVILGSAAVILNALPTSQILDLVQKKVATLGPWAPLAFGAAYFLAAVLFVPGSALTLAAGAIFGLWKGTVTVSIASTSAAGASFLIARYLARERVRRMAESNRTFGSIDRAIEQGGWKIIALLRLSPAVPFSIGNYLYGLTPVRFWPYLIASWIAMLPGTFLYVYLGYAGRSAAGAGTGEKSPWQWVLLGAGLLATVVVTIYVTRMARKALRETPAHKVEPETGSDLAHADKSRGSRLWPVMTTAIVLATLAACAQVNRARLGSLFGPPRVALREAYATKSDGPTFDHARFDALLHKRVSDGGWIDYAAIKTNPVELDAYIAAIGSAPIETLGRDERLALLINAYNAFTLRLIIDHYPLKSIKDIPAAERWDAKRWNIAGKTYSLNQIEHELIRPNFAEPRIHFALVCAAIGCPPLRNEAYVGSRLEQQLADQAKYVHSHERWFRVHPERNEVELTALYDWYASDFEQSSTSVVAYAAQFSPELVRMINAGQNPRVRFLDYDWTLNSIANRPTASGGENQ